MRGSKIEMLVRAAAEQYTLRGEPETILADFVKAACLVAPERCPARFSVRTVAECPADSAFMAKMTAAAKHFVDVLFGIDAGDEDDEALDAAIGGVPAEEFSFDVIATSWVWRRRPEYMPGDVVARIDIITIGGGEARVIRPHDRNDEPA